MNPSDKLNKWGLPKETVYEFAHRWYKNAEDAVNTLPSTHEAYAGYLQELEGMRDLYTHKFITRDEASTVRIHAKRIIMEIEEITGISLEGVNVKPRVKTRLHNVEQILAGKDEHIYAPFHERLLLYQLTWENGEWTEDSERYEKDLIALMDEIREFRDRIIRNEIIENEEIHYRVRILFAHFESFSSSNQRLIINLMTTLEMEVDRNCLPNLPDYKWEHIITKTVSIKKVEEIIKRLELTLSKSGDED